MVRLLGRYSNCETGMKKLRDLVDRARSEHVERRSKHVHRGQSQLSVEQNEKIVSLYDAGWTPTQLAESLGTTEWTVHHRLNRNGIQRRPRGVTGAEVGEALRLNDAGIPITELCARFGRSWKTAAKELRRARAEAR